MPKNNFRSDFNPHSVRDWEKVAQQELGNKNPWENLTKAKRGATIKPYYDEAASVKHKKIYLPNAASCENIPKVTVSDERRANDEALTHLNAGADGIWFDIQQPVNPAKLLDRIELAHCSVYFNSKNDTYFNSFADFIESKSIQEKATGAFFWSDLEKLNPRQGWKKFHLHGIIIRENENVVDEIVDSLLMTVDLIERLGSKNFSAEQSFRSIAFSISVGTDFFLSIAKIRALKNVWFTLQEAYNVKDPVSAFVHAYSASWTDPSFQPHGNMLKQTTAGMAAYFAGCNALTIDPQDNENKMMSRVARNVALMLSEESRLSKVNDPLAGSFYVEALTNQIAEEAWKKFQLR